MRIHRILLETKAEGPGNRACIWVQGCKHGCKGCFAKHTWDYELGQEMSTEEIIQKITKVIDKIDGVTLLGGEPMDQADELSQVARFVKEAGKNIITFTGYVYEELLGMNKSGVKELLEYTDLLADGPFIEELRSFDRPLLGSSNQRFLYLSEAIKQEEMQQYHNSFEIRVSKAGKIQVNGMGDIDKLKDYLNKHDGGKDEFTNI